MIGRGNGHMRVGDGLLRACLNCRKRLTTKDAEMWWCNAECRAAWHAKKGGAAIPPEPPELGVLEEPGHTAETGPAFVSPAPLYVPETVSEAEQARRGLSRLTGVPADESNLVEAAAEEMLVQATIQSVIPVLQAAEAAMFRPDAMTLLVLARQMLDRAIQGAAE